MMFQDGKITFREAQGNTATAVFLGDCCPKAEGTELLRQGLAPTIFREVKPFITESDLKIIQWETPLTRNEKPICKSGPNLNCDPAAAAVINELGIDVALLGNNHTGDQGTCAVIETMDILKQTGARTVGAGKNSVEANAPLFLECNGIRIALLNRAENEFGMAGRDKPGAAPLSVLDDIEAIRACRKEADQVWIAIHGGHEYNPFPSPRMQKTYRAFADAGASMVFNCHTHCPEGIELYNGVPIVYCPGNFYFPSFPNRPATWWTGYMPRVSFDRNGIFALEIAPYQVEYNGSRIRLLAGTERVDFLAYLEEISEPLNDAGRLQELFESWCTRYGEGYLRGSIAVDTTRLPEDPATLAQWMGLRNLFTCESHNDMLRQLLLLIEEQRVAQARAGLEYIDKLQRPTWGADNTEN